MTFAKEITGGSWYGVQLPSWLRAFDCRSANVFEDPLSPWGTVLFSAEKAEVDLGLRGKNEGDEYPFYHATTPLSCSTYIDARVCGVPELVRQITDMVREATKLYEEWVEAEKHLSEGEGGSCLYCPVAICLSNFGWSILSDTRTRRVRRFGYNAK